MYDMKVDLKLSRVTKALMGGKGEKWRWGEHVQHTVYTCRKILQ